VRGGRSINICCNIVWALTALTAIGLVILNIFSIQYYSMYNFGIDNVTQCQLNNDILLYRDYITTFDVITLCLSFIMLLFVSLLSPECR
jgi:hypothetical protein